VRPAPQVQRSQLWRAMLLVPVLITMAASAALHDGYAYLDGFAIHLRFTKFFGAVFGAVVLWENRQVGTRVPCATASVVTAGLGFGR